MSFIFANYFWFLPLIAAPLILHFIKKRNYQDVNFSTLKFFLKINSDVIKKNNIINLLLLIIRTLIILIIIIILARPIFKSTNNQNGATESLISMIIDNSVTNFSNLDKDLPLIIQQIKNQYDLNTFIDIYYFGETDMLYSGKLTDYNNDINWDVSYHKDDLKNTLSSIKQYLENISFNKTLLIYSDFQNNKTNKDIRDFVSENINEWDVLMYKTSNNYYNAGLFDVDVST